MANSKTHPDLTNVFLPIYLFAMGASVCVYVLNEYKSMKKWCNSFAFLLTPILVSIPISWNYNFPFLLVLHVLNVLSTFSVAVHVREWWILPRAHIKVMMNTHSSSLYAHICRKWFLFCAFYLRIIINFHKFRTWNVLRSRLFYFIFLFCAIFCFVLIFVFVTVSTRFTR